jgi:hypothetical protein
MKWVSCNRYVLRKLILIYLLDHEKYFNKYPFGCKGKAIEIKWLQRSGCNPFQKLGWKLLYVFDGYNIYRISCTYSTSLLSWFMHKCRQIHSGPAKRMFRCIQGTLDLGILYEIQC